MYVEILVPVYCFTQLDHSTEVILCISLVSSFLMSLPFFYDGLLKHPSLLLLYCLSVKLDYSSSSPLLASEVCLLQPGLLLSILPYHEQAKIPIRTHKSQ